MNEGILAVDVAPIANIDDRDDAGCVGDFVDHAVLPDANPPGITPH